MGRVADIKAFVARLKSAPCDDCGVSYPPHVMDLDHRVGPKCFNMSEAYRHSWDEVQAEALKVSPVCANCHRHRTYLRQKWPEDLADE